MLAAPAQRIGIVLNAERYQRGQGVFNFWPNNVLWCARL